MLPPALCLITLQWSKVVNGFCSDSVSLCIGTVPSCVFCADLSVLYISILDFHSGYTSCKYCWCLTCSGGGFLRMSHMDNLGSLFKCLTHTLTMSVPVHMSLSGLACQMYSWPEPAACAAVPLVTCREFGIEKKRKRTNKNEKNRQQLFD